MKTKVKSLLELANRRNKFAVVVCDETEYWREDIAKKAGKIEGVYLVDLTKPTHLCELSVSFWAKHISNRVQNYEAFDEIELAEIEASNYESDCYYSGRSTFKIAYLFTQKGITEDEAFESELANPSYC
jgi:hypothetical protein